MTTKALIAQVPFGLRSIEGLMLPDGTYAIAAVQANELLSFAALPENVARSVKRMLGKDYSPIRQATELNSNKAVVLTLAEFERILLELALAGNQHAQVLARELVGLSLTQLFSDAFGQRFDAEDRQAYLSVRQQTRQQHQPCVTKHWCDKDGISTGAEYANRTVFLKIAAGLPSRLRVSDMSTQQLAVWSKAQERYGNGRELKLNHREALEFVKQMQADNSHYLQRQM